MSTELAVRNENPFDPSNITEAMSLATTLSRSGLMPKALINKPADILVIMIKGNELGLSTMQAISSMSVINGKVCMEAAPTVGLCLAKRNICEYFRLVSGDEKAATYETKRVGSESVKLTFTMAEAVKANLTSKENWKNYPAAMLRARASMHLARAVYPDLVAGIYTPDEIERDARPVNGATLSVVQNVPGATPGSVAGAGIEGGSAAPSAEAAVSQHFDDAPPDEVTAAEFDAQTGGVIESARVPFGKKSGTAVGDLTVNDLAWYKAAAEKALGDDSKARYHEKERAWLQAIEGEISRRAGGSK